jgi:polar amino acid transport system permease protein
MGLDLSVIARNLDYLLLGRQAQGELGGLALTVLMALTSGALALGAGTGLAFAAWLLPPRPRRLLLAVAGLIRSVPLIFVIFWIYFLAPALLGSDVPGTLSVVLALAWFSAAAVMHSTFAGLAALPPGQREAGISTGLREVEVLRLILLPQALRNLVPSYIGLLVSLIKDTSLAFIVNVPELTTVSSQVNNRTQVYPAEIFLFTGAVYYLLCQGLSLAAERLSRAIPGR